MVMNNKRELLNKITRISDNEIINDENYMEALFYSDNLEKIIMILDDARIFDKTCELLPSFKGKKTCEKYNIESNEFENQMLVGRFLFHSLTGESIDILTAALMEAANKGIDQYGRRTSWDGNILTVTLLKKERAQ